MFAVHEIPKHMKGSKERYFIRTKHTKGILCSVLISRVLLNLLCVWILFQNASSRPCFRTLAVVLVLER